jgi:hypothetical protein
MSIFSKVRGTIETLFQLGLGGPQWKNNAGAIEARDAIDASFVVGRGSDPVTSNDWVTLGYFGAHTAPIEVEVDFGTKPVTDAQFTIINAQSLPTSKIVATLSGKTATGRTDGDAQWDAIQFAALPGTGSFTLFALCSTGSVVGKRIVQYTLS